MQLLTASLVLIEVSRIDAELSLLSLIALNHTLSKMSLIIIFVKIVRIGTKAYDQGAG